ncbi:hypothetical protein LguiA_008785 [Lonicera macranthoides]
MARSEEGEDSQRGAAGPSTETPRVRKRPDPFLVVCKCFSVITSLAAILCIGVNVLSAVQSFKHGYDIFDGIFRCYAVAFAIFVVVVETEWGYIMKYWKVLEFWVGRGMLQIFVAVMTRAYPETASERRELITLLNIAGYLLLACGAVYVISGVLCIGFLKRARQRREVSAEQAIKDLQELERRREELQALLVVESA